MYCRSFKRKPQECWNRGAIPLLVLAKVYIRGCTPFNNNNDYAPLNYPAQQVMSPASYHCSQIAPNVHVVQTVQIHRSTQIRMPICSVWESFSKSKRYLWIVKSTHSIPRQRKNIKIAQQSARANDEGPGSGEDTGHDKGGYRIKKTE